MLAIEGLQPNYTDADCEVRGDQLEDFGLRVKMVGMKPEP